MEKQAEKELKPVKINVSIQAEIKISIEGLSEAKQECCVDVGIKEDLPYDEMNILGVEVLKIIWKQVLDSKEFGRDFQGNLNLRPGEIADAISKNGDFQDVTARKIGSVFKSKLNLHSTRTRKGFIYSIDTKDLLDMLDKAGIDWEGDLWKILQSEQREHMAGELKSLMQRYVAGELFEADEQGAN